MRNSLIVLYAAVVLMLCPVCSPAQQQQTDLTFFGWSDQHVGVKGEAAHVHAAIDAMNELPGTPYPARIGGKVDKPAFVVGCGDSTEWPTHAAKNAYSEALTSRLKFPAYEMVGNHDEGGKVPSNTVKDWIIARHGALSYTFEHAGVLFIMTWSPYDEKLANPAQPIHKSALEFIRTKLAQAPRGQPAIVALHLCFEAITNRDELVDAFGDANVILVLGGHYHKHTINEYRGRRFLQLPSPQSTTMFTVVRITPTRLTALPWDYKTRRWIEEPRMVLDAALKPASATTAPAGSTRE